MKLHKVILFGLASIPVVIAQPGVAAQTVAGRDNIQLVERGLRPAVNVRGTPRRMMTLAARMRHYRVPGVSIAVIDKGRVVWARGFGAREQGRAPVTADTLFQAASMSKPVAAAVSLTLVSQGQIDLDAPANDTLRSWKLPSSNVAPASEVTLRRLLSHSAGLNVHGFAGYEEGASIPTLPQLLDGVKPANSAPVRIDLKPGTLWRYSGGGAEVAQLMVEDATGKPFAEVAQNLVLGPVGMKASGYLQPLPAERARLAATAYDGTGKAIKGRWHIYPELAAAGLWTTPSDLARFLIAVQRASQGATDAGVPPEVARRLTDPQPGLVVGQGGMGLGFFVSGKGRARHFLHGGDNAGFHGVMIAFPETGQGAVVMTNGDGGAALADEIVRSIAAAYHWPDSMQRSVVPRQLSEQDLANFQGRYAMEDSPDVVFEITREGDHLTLRSNGGPPRMLRAESDHEFFNENTSQTFDFSRDTSGRATALRIEFPNFATVVARAVVADQSKSQQR